MACLFVIFDSLLFLISLFIWLTLLYKHKRIEKNVFFLSLVVSLLFIVYVPSIEKSSSENTSDISPQTTTLIGKINSSINYQEKVIDFNLKTHHPQHNYLAVYFPDENEDLPKQLRTSLQVGATCKLTGEVTMPVDNTNPGQFNYRSYLQKQGIDNQFIIESLDDIQCEGGSFLGELNIIREHIQESILDTYHDDTAAWMIALVLGNDSFIEDETIELFRRWGLSHLLAISGLHVGLIIGLVYFLLINIGLMTKERAQWFMIVFLPIYAIIAGGEPSVWRASLMAFIFIILSKLKFNLTVTDILSIVFITLILVDKYIIYHVGFQLSFIVTFSIILSRKWVMDHSSLLFQMLKISFISQMVILPLQFAYFSIVQPASILLNVIVVPYFSLLIIPSMFLMMMLSPIPLLPTVFDKLFRSIHTFLLEFLTQIDQTLNFPWVSGLLPLWSIILYYALFVLLMSFILKGKLVQAFNCGVILVLTITFVLLRPYFSPYGSVTMLDIGQGDAFVIELPYRKGVIFMDAGSTFSFLNHVPSDRVYKQIIKPYLYSQGIQAIDTIFISHKHIDHMGSVDFLVEEFDTKQVVISNYYELNAETEKSWYKNDVEVKRVHGGEQVTIKNVIFEILSPFRDIISENDNSLVAFAELGDKSWLFTGDIENDAEKELVQHYPNLTADVLKVAHHGSDTSSDELFINQIRPSYALISVGENNSYGHPSPTVIENLEKVVPLVMRTDQDGAIIYKFNDKSGTFYHYSP